MGLPTIPDDLRRFPTHAPRKHHLLLLVAHHLTSVSSDLGYSCAGDCRVCIRVVTLVSGVGGGGEILSHCAYSVYT